MMEVVISNVYADGNRGSVALAAAIILATRRLYQKCRISLVTEVLFARGRNSRFGNRHVR